MAETNLKTPGLPLSQSNSAKKKKKKKTNNKSGQAQGKAAAEKKIKAGSTLGKAIPDLQVSKLGIAETSDRPKLMDSEAFHRYMDYWAKINADLDAELEAKRSSSTGKSEEVESSELEREIKWEEPKLSDSDVEREDSLKEYVPELPIFVNFRQKCPNLRRIPTSRTGLFIYTGESCLYWPKLDEIPTKFPDSLKERLRATVEEGDEKNYQLMIDNYEERYKLWHIYGKFRMCFHDREALEKSFNELLDELILQNSVFYHFTGKKWGYGTFWKREMSRSAKTPSLGVPEDRVLEGAKLWKKPLIRGELKYDKATRRTQYKGSWEDEEDSDFETCPSPPR